jgi:hypothetical protein
MPNLVLDVLNFLSSCNIEVEKTFDFLVFNLNVIMAYVVKMEWIWVVWLLEAYFLDLCIFLMANVIGMEWIWVVWHGSHSCPCEQSKHFLPPTILAPYEHFSHGV